MINKEEYVIQSLEVNLFWERIMKEHLLFLEAGFPKKYTKLIKDLENNININDYKIKKVEKFWDEIMMEHSLFIRGMLDPGEERLIGTSNEFYKKFKELLKEVDDINKSESSSTLVDTLIETTKIIDFKKSGGKGYIRL